MGGGVTYQGVISPNRFEKFALNLEIQEWQEWSTRIFFKVPGAGFRGRG
jgi:hypothetical protein